MTTDVKKLIKTNNPGSLEIRNCKNV